MSLIVHSTLLPLTSFLLFQAWRKLHLCEMEVKEPLKFASSSFQARELFFYAANLLSGEMSQVE